MCSSIGGKSECRASPLYVFCCYPGFTLLAPIDPPCLQPAHPRHMRLPWTVPATLDARLTLECLASLFQAMHAHLDPTSDLQGIKYGKEGSGRLHAAECFLVPTIPTRGIKFCFSPASYPLCFSSIFFWFLYVVTDWMALSEAEQVTNKYRAIVVITISGQQ